MTVFCCPCGVPDVRLIARCYAVLAIFAAEGTACNERASAIGKPQPRVRQISVNVTINT